VVDVDPSSPSYDQIVHRTEMPNVGDELHFGWNACSSACHSQLQRDTLIVPGMRSSRIHMLDISDPRAPRIKDVIEGEEIKQKLGLSTPHTVHCMPGDIVTVSMLGDAEGTLPGGFAVLDARDFSVAGRWEREKTARSSCTTSGTGRATTRLSPANGTPRTPSSTASTQPMLSRASTVGVCTSGTSSATRVVQTLDLGDEGLIPLEIRWQHDADSAQGFVGATLSSNIIRFHRENESWAAEKVIDIPNEELDGWPLEGGVLINREGTPPSFSTPSTTSGYSSRPVRARVSCFAGKRR
jgi:methanethiol oxidase